MKMIVFIISLVLLSLQTLYANPSISSPVGLWKTIDDVTGKPKAIIQIKETSDKSLYGRILKVFPQQDRRTPNEVCTACEGKLHNKRIIGLKILENLKHNESNTNEWGDGKILDPKNGKTYNCLIRLTENGQKLNARGYIGLPLFGRTQTWLRVDESQTA